MSDRRTFVKSAAVATAALAASPGTALAASGENDFRDAREYYELRAYRLKPGASHTALDSYFEKALVPALNRRGIRNVGVFTQPDAPDGPAVWVLMAHRDLASIGAVNTAINADPAVVAAGADYLSAPTKDNPAFDRIDSWVFLAFAGMPRLEVPLMTAGNQPRIFELRIYESFSELKALKKVAMFNAGEIELMKALKQSPVFYGQALAGRDLPQLTYLLCTPDRAAAVTAWKAFVDHPAWKALNADPQYADTVSKITSRFLVRRAIRSCESVRQPDAACVNLTVHALPEPLTVFARRPQRGGDTQGIASGTAGAEETWTQGAARAVQSLMKQSGFTASTGRGCSSRCTRRCLRGRWSSAGSESAVSIACD